MMLNFMNSTDKGLVLPWRFPITDCDKLVRKLSTYGSRILYCASTADHFDLELLTFHRMLLLIHAAFGFMDHISMCVKGHTFGWHNASVTLDQLLSVMLLCLSREHIG